MTRKELNKEIKKIDAFIEVLQGFLKNQVCVCISHVNNQDQQFTEENKAHLKRLINIRNFLLPLQGEADAVLADIHYKPVEFTC